MRYLTALLTWWAADPHAIDTETPRCAAAVQIAHASLYEEKNAEQNKDDPSRVGHAVEGGLQDDAEPTEDESGRHQPAFSSSERVLLEEAQGLETRCANGSCVAVPRPPVRSRYYRKR